MRLLKLNVLIVFLNGYLFLFFFAFCTSLTRVHRMESLCFFFVYLCHDYWQEKEAYLLIFALASFAMLTTNVKDSWFLNSIQIDPKI